jgi:hypothetical protein
VLLRPQRVRKRPACPRKQLPQFRKRNLRLLRLRQHSPLRLLRLRQHSPLRPLPRQHPPRLRPLRLLLLMLQRSLPRPPLQDAKN